MFTLEIWNSTFYNCDSLEPEKINWEYTWFQILTFDKVKKATINWDYIIYPQ